MSNKSNDLAVALVKLATAQFEGYMHIHLCHWNVVGEGFLALHEYFGELYTMLWEDVDVVAERLRALNYLVPYNVFGSFADKYTTKSMIHGIIIQFEAIDEQLNAVLSEAVKVNNQATINMAANLQEKYDKELWKLRSIEE